MTRNNSPARRAQRHADAVARQALVITCTRCGTRHASTRPCRTGTFTLTITPDTSRFQRLLRSVAARVSGWAWRGHHA